MSQSWATFGIEKSQQSEPWLRTTAGILVLLCGSISQAATAGIETFDTDAAGFVANTTSSVVIWAASEGNPDGHIQTRKDLSEPVFDTGALTTDADFTGDYASDGITAATVDLMAIAGDVDTAWFRVRRDVFTNGWRYPLASSLSPNDGWGTYDVTFDPTWTNMDAQAAGWLMDQDIDAGANPSPDFADVMSSVGRAEVRIASTGSSVVGIDNFGLVPEPNASVLSLLAILGLITLRRSR